MIKAVVFDLDGVIYFGDQPAERAVEIIKKVRQSGLRPFFITNNSARSRQGIIKKLSGMGIKVDLDEVMTSGFATALHLKRIGAKNIYVLGTDELKREFKKLELTLVKQPPCSYLVVGFDQYFDYNKIIIGLDALLGGARFIACNQVPNFPIEHGRIVPGLGAMIGALSAASEREPDIVIGKPNLFMLRELVLIQHLRPENIMIVGDDPEIDIAMANKFGSSSVLVGQKAKQKLKKNERPDFIINKLCGLLPILKEIK